MIKNIELWLKIQNRIGTDDQKKRLKEMLANKEIDLSEYYIILAQWAANASRKRNETS